MARQVDALRISFLSSVDGQVRLDPGSSGTMPVRRYRDLRPHGSENSGDVLTQTLSIDRNARK
jgi:hypothetical protein